MNLCFVIPVYNHEKSIGNTLSLLRDRGLHCILVDDGSDPCCERRLVELAEENRWVTLIRRPVNGGKGAAVMDGAREAHARGFSHMLQIDADGQHDASDVQRFIDASRRAKHAVVTGQPVYDDSVPTARRYGRYACHVWVWINTLSFDIRDAMCGFRIYPLAPLLRLMRSHRLTRRMDFDVEVLVRLHWEGVEVINVPTHVGYPSDGVSHFQPLRDNLRIIWLHTRLFFGMLLRLPFIVGRRLRRGAGLGATSAKLPR